MLYTEFMLQMRPIARAGALYELSAPCTRCPGSCALGYFPRATHWFDVAHGRPQGVAARIAGAAVTAAGTTEAGGA